MGNSLLDFVMALVRDPAAAARYAADPAGTLADAHLPGVTITDVANLMPVVTDSLAMATPDFGVVGDTVNVWTTGAAAAALDAFDIPHPVSIARDPAPQFSAVQVVPPGTHEPARTEPAPEPVVIEPILDHPPAEPVIVDGAWQPAHDAEVVDHHPAGHPGFDLF